jgi:choline dehydrogenase
MIFECQILIEDKVAVGVEYTHHGVPKTAAATKEVILSAGCYISPLILIKSGIGPEDQLKAATVITHTKLYRIIN